MSCEVCRGEERFILADFNGSMLMGYVVRENPEKDDEKVPHIALYLQNGDGDFHVHKQIAAFCPICGDILFTSEEGKQMVSDIHDIYKRLHAERVSMRKELSGDEEREEA